MDKSDAERACYLLTNQECGQFSSELNARNISPCINPTFSRQKKEIILRDYLNIIGEIAVWNSDNILWWASNISSKNRFNSVLGTQYFMLMKCLESISSLHSDQTIFIVCPSWPITVAVSAIYRNRDVNLMILARPWQGLRERVQGRLSSLLLVIRGAFVVLGRILEARCFYRSTRTSLSKEPVYLIKSFSYRKSFHDSEGFQDPFFGQLAGYLSGELAGKDSVLTLAVALDDRRECYRLMRRSGENPVEPLESYLTFKDLLGGVYKIIAGVHLRSFRLSGELMANNQDVSSLFSECLACGGGQVDLYQYLHKSAGRRIAATHKIIGCAITFEGNPWEKMFIAGLHEWDKEIPVYGYQHAVVPQAAAGVFVTDSELTANIPLPDFILTTGPIPAAIIRRFSRVGNRRVFAACALRHDYLEKLDLLPRPLPNVNPSILVALEGVKDVLPMVRYILKQSLLNPNIHFVVRAHPVFPFTKFLRMMNTDVLPGNIEISKNRSVREDVSASHVVLYWGTTISIEALMMGIPVIHFDRGDSISYDPLFDLDFFKWTVYDGVNLAETVAIIKNLSAEEYELEQNLAKHYVKEYFKSVSHCAMAGFLARPAVSNINNI